ncbi:MAG: hypothetical protein ACRDD1_05145 [Planctomycetia bacterium]
MTSLSEEFYNFAVSLCAELNKRHIRMSEAEEKEVKNAKGGPGWWLGYDLMKGPNRHDGELAPDDRRKLDRDSLYICISIELDHAGVDFRKLVDHSVGDVCKAVSACVNAGSKNKLNEVVYGVNEFQQEKKSYDGNRLRVTLFVVDDKEYRSRSLSGDQSDEKLDTAVSELVDALETARQEIRNVIERMRAAVEPKLMDVIQTGRSYTSYEKNQALIEVIRDASDTLGIRFECPNEGCGRPSKLKVSKKPRLESGAFYFSHPISWDEPGNFTTHGGTRSIPPNTKIIEAENSFVPPGLVGHLLKHVRKRHQTREDDKKL